MKPFIHEELLAVNTDLQGQIVYFQNTKVLLVDNFFKNFEFLRETINKFPPGDWKLQEGSKNFIDYYDCKFTLLPPTEISLYKVTMQMVQDQYESKDVEPIRTVNVNWFKQIIDKRNNYAWPHTDNYSNNIKSYTVLAYLNAVEECDGGTVFFNELKSNPNNEQMDYWGADQACWEQIGVIKMIPNRLIVFPADVYHSAYHPNNGFFNHPRLTMLFQIQEKCL